MPEFPVPDGQTRVTDADRQRVATALETALGDGRLSLVDFDARTRSAWAAATRADLDRLTSDLPRPAPPRVDDDPDDTAKAVMRGWFIVTFANFAVWFVLAVNQGFTTVHPWWIWVALSWPAVALVLRYRRRRSREEP